MRARFAELSLLWRVFVTNAAVLVLAFALLVLAPVTVSIPIALTEAIVLLAGTVALLVLDFALLKPALAPLRSLSAAMQAADPLRPGRRAPVTGGADLRALSRTFNEMLDRLEAERRDSARRALQVQEDERRRIARELHDEVGQTLTAVILQAEGLAARAPAALRDDVEDLRETARLGAEDVRRIAVRLRPEALDDLGLHRALLALAATFGEHAAVRIDRRVEPVTGLTEEQELVVYRVAQEALTNVARHARATRAELALVASGDEVRLRVGDDGRGLPPEAEAEANGIRGMRERAMLVGARLVIGAAPGGGTEVLLRVPRGGGA